MFAAFGFPNSADHLELQIDSVTGTGAGAGPTHGIWYLSLLPRRDSGRISTDIDETTQFTIRGKGEDVQQLTPLAAICMLNALMVQPDRYQVEQPSRPADKPVVWEITHHSSMTEHLIGFLEGAVPGLFFTAHYNIPDMMVEEDDSDIIGAMRQLCDHPMCSYSRSGIAYRAEAESKLRKDIEGSGVSAVIKKNQLEQFQQEVQFCGCGILLGFDIDDLSRSIAVLSFVDDRDMDGGDEVGEAVVEVTYPYDLSGCMRPLEERLRFFFSEGEDVMQAVSDYLTAYRLATAVAYDSNEGSLVEGDDDDDDDEADIQEQLAKKEELNRLYANAKVKIVDLGNACWTHKHFTDDIQTRQYRSPEVILGADYGTSADMWSLGCVVFELLTGDLLFDPHAGKSWDREEDHLAMMSELLGKFPKSVYTAGKNSSTYFSKKGDLKHIHNLKFWGLAQVLCEKYKFSEQDSNEIADFMLPMLEVK